VRVISLKRLRAFWEAGHADAEGPLRNWYRMASKADWSSIVEVKRQHPQADAVRLASGQVLTVFNIGGNKFRLITRIRFEHRLINVRVVLTHADYDKADWKKG
jgi:mRNA interferase HigB